MTYPVASVPAFYSWPVPLPGSTLEEWQAGRCAMCGYGEPLVTDHCHATGLIRGLLCRSCNSLEAHSTHGRFLAWRAGCNPARLLGIEEVYISPYTGLPDVRTPLSAAERDEVRRAIEALPMPDEPHDPAA